MMEERRIKSGLRELQRNFKNIFRRDHDTMSLGNCFYHAVVQQLRRPSIHYFESELGNMENPEEDVQNSDRLRQIICQTLEDMVRVCEDFKTRLAIFANNDFNEGKEDADVVMLSDDDAIQKLLELQRNSSTWVCEPFVLAAAITIQHPIVILRKDGIVLQTIEPFLVGYTRSVSMPANLDKYVNTNNEPIFLGYLPNLHYQSLLPVCNKTFNYFYLQYVERRRRERTHSIKKFMDLEIHMRETQANSSVRGIGMNVRKPSHHHRSSLPELRRKTKKPKTAHACKNASLVSNIQKTNASLPEINIASPEFGSYDVDCGNCKRHFAHLKKHLSKSRKCQEYYENLSFLHAVQNDGNSCTEVRTCQKRKTTSNSVSTEEQEEDDIKVENVKCQGCGKDFKHLLKHLKKSECCQSHYDINKIKEQKQKQIQKKKNKLYYEKQKERLKIQYQEHQQERQDYGQEYYKRHQQERQDYGQEYYKRHQQERQDYDQEYYKRHQQEKQEYYKRHQQEKQEYYKRHQQERQDYGQEYYKRHQQERQEYYQKHQEERQHFAKEYYKQRKPEIRQSQREYHKKTSHLKREEYLRKKRFLLFNNNAMDRLKLFLEDIQTGLTFVCIICDRLLFKKQVNEVSNAIILEKMISASTKYKTVDISPVTSKLEGSDVIKAQFFKCAVVSILPISNEF